MQPLTAHSVRPLQRLRRLLVRSIGLTALLLLSTAHAATYYVRQGGDDSANGRTHDTAWATLAKVNDFDFATSDRVLFYEGGRWEGQILVDWSGTADAPAVIGAYHLRNGVPTAGYRTQRPVIDGTDTIPDALDGLVRVRGAHVRVAHLSVRNSEGRGIQFMEAPYGEVIGCLTDNTYKTGIKFVDSPHASIRGNFVAHAGVTWPEDNGVWGGAIELVRSDYGVIAGNSVVEVYGEGINSNDGTVGALIENNFVFGARAVGIYVDAAPDTTVRRNVVFGTANSEFWREGQTTGAGIVLNNETYHYTVRGLPWSVQSRRARIYGNIVAYTSGGIGFWGQFDSSRFDDTLVFNNTLVDNTTQLVVRDHEKPGSMFVNNILLSLSPGTRDVDRSDLGGMTARSNYLSQGDPGGDLSHPGNRYDGLRLARMSGWRLINNHADVNWEDFKLLPGSSAIAAGDGDPRAMAAHPHDYDVDYRGLAHGVPMDMGALYFPGTEYKVPKRPTGLVGRP